MSGRLGEDCPKNPTEMVKLHCLHVVGYDTPEKHFECCWCGVTVDVPESLPIKHGPHRPQEGYTTAHEADGFVLDGFRG